MVVGSKPSKFRTISRVSTSTKATAPSRKSNYQGQDSNLHAFRHQILSLARLPIPPPWPFDHQLLINRAWLHFSFVLECVLEQYGESSCNAKQTQERFP